MEIAVWGAELSNVTALAFERANLQAERHIKSASIPLNFLNSFLIALLFEGGGKKNTQIQKHFTNSLIVQSDSFLKTIYWFLNEPQRS